jgi:hypothetical protein
MGEWRYSSTFLDLGQLDGGEWSASCPGRFTPGERASGTHWIGWLGFKVGLDAMEKRQILHCRESNPGRRYTELSRLLYGIKNFYKSDVGINKHE